MKSIFERTRNELANWQQELASNIIHEDDDLTHSIAFHFAEGANSLITELNAFGERVARELETTVNANNQDHNLPTLDQYDDLGEAIYQVNHNPLYSQAGDIIYSTRLLERLSKPGGMAECLSFLLLSAHAGEAGHNCPIACSAGVIRVLQKVPDFEYKAYFLQQLIKPWFTENFTGAQFVTEIQGGSDVGQNQTRAEKDNDGKWRIYGEKWFCSNANADLILLIARFKPSDYGTHNLGLFLVPAKLSDGRRNHYRINRLKEKLGTRSMATAEIEFDGAYAIAMGPLEDSFRLLMENVLHLSRIFNAFCVLGMARRAWQIARGYAKHRVAFGSAIIHYPLVQENLAIIKAENTAMLAACFDMAVRQDQLDTAAHPNENDKLLLRLLANLNKYFTAMNSVNHIRHCIDVLAGNGMIESFSTLPRLLRDCLVCENWEGTHYTLWMQILRDIHKHQIDKIFVKFISGEIKALSQETEVSQLNEKLHQLNEVLNQLQTEDAKLQTLKIKTIVELMAIIYSAVCLLKEAMHQQTNQNRTSKMQAWKLFQEQHLASQSKLSDKDYLDLIASL